VQSERYDEENDFFLTFSLKVKLKVLRAWKARPLFLTSDIQVTPMMTKILARMRICSLLLVPCLREIRIVRPYYWATTVLPYLLVPRAECLSNCLAAFHVRKSDFAVRENKTKLVTCTMSTLLICKSRSMEAASSPACRVSRRGRRGTTPSWC